MTSYALGLAAPSISMATEVSGDHGGGASEREGVVFNEGGGCSSSLLIQYEGVGHINCMVTCDTAVDTERAPPPRAYSQEHDSSCATGSPPPPRGDLSSPSVLSHFLLHPLPSPPPVPF